MNDAMSLNSCARVIHRQCRDARKQQQCCVFPSIRGPCAAHTALVIEIAALGVEGRKAAPLDDVMAHPKRHATRRVSVRI
jgi:hypothetical protein